MAGGKMFRHVRKPKVPAVKKIDKQQDKEIHKLKKDVALLKGSNERKHFDENLSFGGFTTTSQQNLLNDVPQGTSDITRIGDQIVCTYLESNFTLSGSFDDTVVVRIVYIWDKQNVITTSALMMQSTGGSDDINAFFDWDKRRMFTVLSDKSYTLTPQNLIDGSVTAINYPRELQIKDRINLRRKKVSYENASNTPNVGALRIIIWSNSGSSGPQLVGKTRLHFVG